MFISTKLDWRTNTANQHHDDSDVAGRNGEEDDISSDVKEDITTISYSNDRRS